MQVGVKALREDVRLPEYGTVRSACADLRAHFQGVEVSRLSDMNQDWETFGKYNVTHNLPGLLEIKAFHRALVPTGLAFDIPEGYSLRVHPRSGLSFKQALTVVCGEGVIDEDYQNELFVPVINLSENSVFIKEGDRIAQIELVKDERCSFGFVEELSDKNSSRNGGFGHTGTN